MASKKVHSLIKGIAVTGTAVSGASSLGDANLAFAQDVEATEEAELVVPVQEATLDLTTHEMEVVSEVAPSDNPVVPVGAGEAAAGVEVVVDSQPEVANADVQLQVSEGVGAVAPSAENINNQLGAVQENVVVDEGTAIAAAEQVQPAQMTIEEEETWLASTSEAAEAQYNSESTSYASAVSEAESAYASESAAYTEAGYDSKELIEARADVDAKLKVEDEVRTFIADKNQKLNSGNYYTTVGRPLAVAMIKFKLILDGTLDDNTASTFEAKWDNRGAYQDKNCKITYTDTNGVFHTEYYDYVTIDENGDSLFKTVGANGKLTDYDDIAKNVDGINVLEKENINTNPNGQAKFNSKGQDWYKKEDYLKDIGLWDALSASIVSLAEKVEQAITAQDEFVDSATASQIASQSTAEYRAESLTARMHSESVVKSQSIADSELVSISESHSLVNSMALSEIESTATSFSESFSESAASESIAVAAAIANVAPAHISVSQVPLSVVHNEHEENDNHIQQQEQEQAQTQYQEAVANNRGNGVSTNQATGQQEIQQQAELTIADTAENMASLHQNQSMDTVTVGDEDSAKYGEAKEVSSSVGRRVLPVLAAIAAFFGVGKVKKEKKDLENNS